MMFRPRDERGSILPMTAILVVVIVTFTAFAVDLGLQRVARSDMQSLASVVALDLARDMEGRTKGAIQSDPEWVTEKNRSVARNITTVGSAPDVKAVLGQVDQSTGDFTEVNNADVPTSVKVLAGTDVQYSFVSGGGGANQSAIASIASTDTCFSVGSFAASLDTQEGALNALLGGIIGVDNLKVLSPGGIAVLDGLNIPLIGLATELGVGTPNELLSLPNLTAAKFLTATANVLSSQGDTVGAELLDAMALKVPALQNINVAKILSLDTGSDAGLDFNANALDLVAAALLAANGTNSLAIPDLAVSVPGLTTVTAKATVTSPPKIACGGPGVTAESSQVSVDLTTGTGKLVSGLSSATVHLKLNVASAKGTLKSVQCRADGESSASIAVTTALVKDLDLGVGLKLLGGLFGSLLSIGADVTSDSVGSGPSKTVNLPPSPQTLGGIDSLNLQHADIDVTGLGVIGKLLGDVLGGVVKPLLGALDPLLMTVLKPLLNLLGVNLGGADVALMGQAGCGGTPKLEG